ncbi:undecaprenyl-diphosphate phosphatase [Tuwongella immobilis]|uniref:Uncharacterized protein n=1 Tax=Tuwongella immobilis TaxID=692036 RepID=A0A6C2YVP3_9BACT|nr:undecaprenyl-diphosphate phosphatase [Tuwongella immobilis]VIP05690.1 unnamed protein product [Tuwongella immobilis]VTS08736.1 unnamed protein product [Tuwongella immobilis]
MRRLLWLLVVACIPAFSVGCGDSGGEVAKPVSNEDAIKKERERLLKENPPPGYKAK